MAQNPSQTPPINPQIADLAQGSSVRRHHTISTTGRLANRIPERRDSEEAATEEYEDEDQWTGGPTATSEKQLQRVLSLPSKYHRALREQSELPGSSLSTSHSVGGLSSVDAGPEEEEWSGVAAALYDGDQSPQATQMRTSQTNPENATSNDPPSASGAVRRHVSMTDGQRARKGGGLQRHPTMSAKPPVRSSTMNATTEATDKDFAPYDDDNAGEGDDPNSYPPESAYGGIQNDWDNTGEHDANWRTNAPAGLPDWRMNQQQAHVEELTSSLSNMDLQRQPNSYAHSGPRFNANHPGMYQEYSQQLQQQTALTHAQRIQLNTEIQGPAGPASAGAYIPQPGHAGYGSIQRESVASMGSGEEHHRTSSGSDWDPKSRMLKGRGSNPSLGQSYQQYGGGAFGNMPPPPPIPSQYLNQVHPRSGSLGQIGGYGMPGQNFGPIGSPPGQVNVQPPPLLDPAAFLSSPIDVPTMIAQKGYNPATFDTRPPYARYFVIKSYTEDDVHKSLKHEIWSSTDPGNKRLDKAFKECAGRGPIYLFFSVNASGHFCGMAEMLTPVDYTRSSTVWASDKWKGVFKVRWIFVRDIPNAVLRNIRLNNTQERKPVTNSRDTQELLPEAGHEMLRIFFTHPAKTSLLQDFAFYELQSLQKQQQAGLSSPPQATSPPLQGTPLPQQHPFAMNNNQYGTPSAHQSPQMGTASIAGSLAMPMGVGHAAMQNYGGTMGLGVGPQVAQSVLRGSSPGPIGSGMPGSHHMSFNNMQMGGGMAANGGPNAAGGGF